MKVGWSGIKYRKDGRQRIYYRFKVYTDSGDVILSASSVIDGIRCNKRRWKPDRIFWKADQYYKGDEFPSLIFPNSYFEITEKELVEWIGRVSLDQVASLDDIGWIMNVKKDL